MTCLGAIKVQCVVQIINMRGMEMRSSGSEDGTAGQNGALHIFGSFLNRSGQICKYSQPILVSRELA